MLGAGELAALGWRADDPLTEDDLTARVRVLQRKRGHRYSLDDVLTARLAAAARPDARRGCDLGCGLGSVLFSLADRLPEASFVGVEAQDVSLELARRNRARSPVAARVTLVAGDLREASVQAQLRALGPYDLISGTPPYVPPGQSTPSPDAQRAHARIELRGGVEDYLRTAGPLLAPGGRVVVCCDARTPERAQAGARDAGLRPLSATNAVPREGKDALFAVWVFGPADEPGPADVVWAPPVVARAAHGARPEAYLALRRFFGLPREAS